MILKGNDLRRLRWADGPMRSKKPWLPSEPTNQGDANNLLQPSSWARAFKIVGLVGVVFGVNPLAAHAVAYNHGPAALAYGFSAFVMLVFCGWWALKAH